MNCSQRPLLRHKPLTLKPALAPTLLRSSTRTPHRAYAQARAASCEAHGVYAQAHNRPSTGLSAGTAASPPSGKNYIS